MGNNGASTDRSDTFCLRCGSLIKADDKMFIIEASMEDGNSIISSICFPCATAILTEAVIGKKLITPALSLDDIDFEGNVRLPKDQSEETEITQAGAVKSSTHPNAESMEHKASLSFQVSGDGFRLGLECTDGLSYATSELFTWNRIAQLLIAANPNIFGDVGEPWHYCFPETLVSLGYNVPDWPE